MSLFCGCQHCILKENSPLALNPQIKKKKDNSFVFVMAAQQLAAQQLADVSDTHLMLTS